MGVATGDHAPLALVVELISSLLIGNAPGRARGGKGWEGPAVAPLVAAPYPVSPCLWRPRARSCTLDESDDLTEAQRPCVVINARGRVVVSSEPDWVVGDLVRGFVGRVRVKPDGTPGAGADPLAVYRAPWHTSRAATAPATEIDLAETVVPPTTAGTTWVVFKERSCVDVLLHHRDSRPVPAHGAWAIVLWRSAPTAAALMATDPTVALGWLVTALAGAGANPAAPAGWGWNLASGSAAAAWTTLSVPLDARLPRAVTVDVDLSAVPDNHHVLFLAIVGSTADDARTMPTTSAIATVPPVTVSQLVQCWPYAAARVVQVIPRPT